MDRGLHPRDWENDAACIGVDTEIYYPPRIKGVYDILANEAKSFCNGDRGAKRKPCPVRERCLEYAIQADELFGIWGGMSHRERNALVRKRHRKNARDKVACHPTCNVCANIEEGSSSVDSEAEV